MMNFHLTVSPKIMQYRCVENISKTTFTAVFPQQRKKYLIYCSSTKMIFYLQDPDAYNLFRFMNCGEKKVAYSFSLYYCKNNFSLSLIHL